VLLVGAPPTLRTVARLHLGAAAGMEVVEAVGDDDAFDLVQRRRVDLAVCAARGNPDERCSWVRRLREAPEPQVRSVPVLMVAERRDRALEAWCGTVGRTAVVVAPVTGPRLVAAVRALLGDEAA
jgi:DNA-binding response OmpR family regulator